MYQSVLNSVTFVQAREKNCSVFDNFETEGRAQKVQVNKIKFNKFPLSMKLKARESDRRNKRYDAEGRTG